ncbi:MAG: sigma-70 family RNA polymerase sigma factor [Verrucomicrobiota bacterium]
MTVQPNDPAESGWAPEDTRSINEDAVLLKVRNGDLEAYEVLMNRYVRQLRAFLAVRVPADYLVDELAQEAFIFAYRNLADFKVGTSFEKWLRAIGFQLVRREKQKFRTSEVNKRRLAEHLAMVMEDGPLDKGERFDDLAHCLEKVSGRPRELIDCKYRQGYSTREMAVAFEQSEDWVRTSLFRLRRQLRACIENRMEQRKTG